MEFLRRFMQDAGAQRTRNRVPVDVLGDRFAVEVKTGLASNRRQSQQWRLQLSTNPARERTQIDGMTRRELARYNGLKSERHRARKEMFLKAHPGVMGVTITLILDMSLHLVDLFWFDGFHSRIGFNSQAAAAAYRHTFCFRP